MAAPLIAGAGALLAKVGLSKASLTAAGTWLKSALWGSTFSKVTTSLTAGSFLIGGKKTAATTSAAAAQVARHAGNG